MCNVEVTRYDRWVVTKLVDLGDQNFDLLLSYLFSTFNAVFAVMIKVRVDVKKLNAITISFQNSIRHNTGVICLRKLGSDHIRRIGEPFCTALDQGELILAVKDSTVLAYANAIATYANSGINITQAVIQCVHPCNACFLYAKCRRSVLQNRIENTLCTCRIEGADVNVKAHNREDRRSLNKSCVKL